MLILPSVLARSVSIRLLDDPRSFDRSGWDNWRNSLDVQSACAASSRGRSRNAWRRRFLGHFATALNLVEIHHKVEDGTFKDAGKIGVWTKAD